MVGQDDDAPTNPFEAPEQQGTEVAAPPAQKVENGLPDVIDLFTATFDDLTANFAGFLLAGVGMLLPMFALILLASTLVFGILCVGPLLGAAVDQPEAGTALSLLLMVPTYLLLIVAAIVISAPLYAGLGRSVLAHIEHDAPLGFSAAYRDLTLDLAQVMLLTLITAVLVFTGALLCYLPALLVSLALGFAYPALIVHRLSAFEAIQRSVSHVLAHPGWHLGYWGLYLAINFVGSAIPLVGAAIAMPVSIAFLLRGYVAVFGGRE